jgi:hypothetical protein
MRRPQILDAVVDVARIQSTEASNVIELPDGMRRMRFRSVPAAEMSTATALRIRCAQRHSTILHGVRGCLYRC